MPPAPGSGDLCWPAPRFSSRICNGPAGRVEDGGGEGRLRGPKPAGQGREGSPYSILVQGVVWKGGEEGDDGYHPVRHDPQGEKRVRFPVEVDGGVTERVAA
jgi:hypothetical protein